MVKKIYDRDTTFGINFVSQFAIWGVVIGKGMLVGHVGTHPYQSQLVMWRVVAQSCAKSCVLSIIQK